MACRRQVEGGPDRPIQRKGPGVSALTDDDLILMYREGDAEAFDTLFDRYATAVHNFARSILGPAGSAEEVLQETFLAVAQTARKYKPRGLFRPWLMRIVRNRCLNRLASRRRRRAMLAGGDLEVIDPASPDPPPSRRAEADEQRAIIRAAVDDLPDRQREAIALYAFEQMTYREIAGILEMPINTVKTLIHRGRAALAQALEPLLEESKREL